MCTKTVRKNNKRCEGDMGLKCEAIPYKRRHYMFMYRKMYVLIEMQKYCQSTKNEECSFVKT